MRLNQRWIKGIKNEWKLDPNESRWHDRIYESKISLIESESYDLNEWDINQNFESKLNWIKSELYER